MRQIVLDTETTGLELKDGHRIIEVGCLEIIDRQLTGNHLHFYINPKRFIEREAFQIHGITESFLTDKPLFEDIAADLITFLKGSELIIHNAPFDIGFLNHELRLTKKPFRAITDYCQITDTLVLACQKHPGQHNNLDALCRRYHVNNSNRSYHGALLDAELLAQVYLLMTGGQARLFEPQSFSIVKESIQIRRLDVKRAPLRIIKANDEEIKSHEAFLRVLKENGVCLWTDGGDR